jgi:hypothetical protein
MTGGSAYATIMGALLALFLARVIGQILAATVAPRWLPPMARWYSGLMPYRYLLPAQVGLLVIMALVTVAVQRESAPLGGPAFTASRWLVGAGYAYAAAMTVRLIRYLRASPERRGVLIPVVFHYVLAAFLLTYGRALGR